MDDPVTKVEKPKITGIIVIHVGGEMLWRRGEICAGTDGMVVGVSFKEQRRKIMGWTA